MIFNSWEYLIFFPISVVIYYFLRGRLRLIFLLLASVFFYMAYIPQYIVILAVLILIDYVAALLISQSQGKKRKFYLLISLVANIGLLGFFKYFNFAIDNIAFLAKSLNFPYPGEFAKIILPIGLSFHTFQSMSYTIEVFRKKYPAEKSLLKYALYVMFFPQLVAGPIERPYSFLPQFSSDRLFNYKNCVAGLRMILWGLFLKMFIADRLALFVNHVYNDPFKYSGMSLLMATIYFSFQIYCDFAGYSLIAIGSAKVLGFDLMDNFKQPYFSANISDFWRRWHISLSSWFRDYVYIPLGGNKLQTVKWFGAILIVFFLSGIWHGSNLTFAIWGLIHGIYYIFYRLLKPIISKLPTVIQILLTFIFVTYSWIFFRANNLSQAIYIAKNIFVGLFGYWQYLIRSLPHLFSGGFSNIVSYQLSSPFVLDQSNFDFVFVLFGLSLLIVFDFVDRKWGMWKVFGSFPTIFRWSLYLIITVLIIDFSVIKSGNFIYFQF